MIDPSAFLPTDRPDFIWWIHSMGNFKGKSEGGSGGKRGHSNMNHWSKTEEIKISARKQRRWDDKQVVAQELNDSEPVSEHR